MNRFCRSRYMLATLGLTALVSFASSTLQATEATQAEHNLSLPAVPITKVLAIGKFVSPPTHEQLSKMLPVEMSATAWLYMDGKIDQWYARLDQDGVVFVMNVQTVAEAQTLLASLPLGQAKMMTFEFIPLGPLQPLRSLLKPRPPSL